MFSHIMLGADDIERSKLFYDAALPTLGIKPGRIDNKGRIIYQHDGGLLMITRPINGKAASAANGGTVGFSAPSPQAVDNWHAAGLAHGGTAIEDLPGLRSNAYGSLYLAYLRDPAGNKLCALHRILP